MNAAFLLVTSAILVGQGGDKDKKATPPPATPAVASSCGSNACCDSYGHRLRDRLHGLFNRNRCDSCQPSCPTQCDNHCRTKLFNFEPRCREPRCHTSCAPAPSCNNDCCGREGIFARLRHSFHRNDTCCDGGCAGTTAPPVKTEKIDNPKKMPDPKKDGKVSTEVRIDAPPFPLAAPTAPTVEVVPVPVPVPSVPTPRVEGERRDPF